MKKYDCVIFDLDGTLLNTELGIVASLREMTAQLSLPPILLSEYSRFIGPPIEQSVKEYFTLDDGRVAQAAKAFREVYTTHYLYDAEPYDGIVDLLEKLHRADIKSAIATYKRHDYAVKVIEHFGLDKFCCPCLGSNAEGTSKSAIIQTCLSELNADISRSVYVGDTEHDRVGAAENGIDFIGVTYGFGFKPNGTKVSVEKLTELLLMEVTI